MKHNKKRGALIWLTAAILFVCLCASTVAVAGQMLSYTPDDSGAIPLIPTGFAQGDSNQATSNISETPSDSTSVPDNTPSEHSEPKQPEPSEAEVSENSTASEASMAVIPQKPSDPGFEATDGKTAWKTNTEVEIFRVSYENGEHVVTVKSGNGQKIIAPGTENSYTFKLKNTGDVPLDCNVKVEAYFSPAGISVPITGRVSRYDGKWVVGSADSYADVASLNNSEDSMTLAAGRYIYYTLDWKWPYDGSNDELDTLIGDMSADEPLTFTIVITTTATQSDNEGGGIMPPSTGDSGYTLWILLLILSLAALILLFFASKRKRDEY